MSCHTCSGPRRDQCVKCPPDWQLADGECHPECPEGFFKSKFGCQKCHHICKTCSSKCSPAASSYTQNTCCILLSTSRYGVHIANHHKSYVQFSTRLSRRSFLKTYRTFPPPMPLLKYTSEKRIFHVMRRPLATKSCIFVVYVCVCAEAVNYFCLYLSSAYLFIQCGIY